MKPADYYHLLKHTVSEWIDDKVPRLGAALAFYSILSLGPLLLLALAAAGLIFGHEAAQGKIVAEIQGLIGQDGARAIQDMIADSAEEKDTGIVASIIGIVMLLVGASGVFGQLQDAMNTIWEVQPKPGRGILGMIRDRFLSFTMVLGTGFMLLSSLVLSTALAALSEYTNGVFEDFAAVMHVVNFIISFAVISLLFAVIFKYLPDAKVAWRDVWTGAIITAFLFTVGKFAIGLYLGHSAFGSSYGAAGSLVVILVWIYYSSQILFFGAEFTQVYANRFGDKIVPAPTAEKVTEGERANQGMKPVTG
ncbi:MAG: ribonuclease [Alphaproteobacteria bacterium]|nr:ribonuclease [Alphaproteobacteria bacterium]